MEQQEARRNLLQALVSVENYKSPQANFENCNNPQVVFNVNVEKDFDPIAADNRIRAILGVTEDECPSLQAQGYKALPQSRINGWAVADTFFRWYFGTFMVCCILLAVLVIWAVVRS